MIEQPIPIPDADTFAPGGPGAAMAAYAQFVVWKIEERADGKPAKVPCDPANGRRINAQNPDYQMTWQDALTVARQRGLGVGFVFTQHDPFAFIDLDDCRDDAGEWTGLAHDVYDRFERAYAEISQSGRGLHLIFTAGVPAHKKRANGVEFYTGGRFVALTGSSAAGDAGADLTARIPDFLADYGLNQTEDRDANSFEWTTSPDPDWSGPPDDGELIERMLNARPSPHAAFGQKATFTQLWQCDEEALGRAYPSESGGAFNHNAADAALCSHLAFWTGRDCERMDRLFRRSGLYRDKWDKDYYRNRTILRACAGCSRVYSGRNDPAPSITGVRSRRLADVEPETVDWLWPGRIPLGKVSMLVGDPGLGKSLITLSIAATVSRGGAWPVAREGRAPAGDVVLVSAEDDAGDTIRPRLDAAGADCRRIHILDGIADAQGRPLPWSLERLDALESLLTSLTDPRLIIIDPVSAYLGGDIDSHRNSDIRALLAPLSEIASRHRVAMLCVSHLNKGNGPAMYRTTGSLAFTAAARAVYIVAKDSTNPARRLVLPVKANLAPDATGLAYQVAPTADGLPYAKWEEEPVKGIDVDDVIAAPRDTGRPDHKLHDGTNLLTELLSDGPVSSEDLHRHADDEGISRRTLHRAKSELDVEAFRENGKWYWRLPG